MAKNGYEVVAERWRLARREGAAGCTVLAHHEGVARLVRALGDDEGLSTGMIRSIEQVVREVGAGELEAAAGGEAAVWQAVDAATEQAGGAGARLGEEDAGRVREAAAAARSGLEWPPVGRVGLAQGGEVDGTAIVAALAASGPPGAEDALAAAVVALRGREGQPQAEGGVWLIEYEPSGLEEALAEAWAHTMGLALQRVDTGGRSTAEAGREGPTLTEEQRAAVEAPREESVIVMAGAGTGKTRTLEARVRKLLAEGVPARGLCVTTFTNAAASELASRVGALQPEGQRRGATIGTYHGIAARVLRARAEAASELLGIDPPMTDEFTILDQDEAISVFQQAAAQVHEDPALRMLKKEAELVMENLDKAARVEPDPEAIAERMDEDGVTMTLKVPGKGGRTEEVPGSRVLREYERRKRRMNALDYRDLIGRTVRMFEADPDTAPNFEAVLADEYQDTDAVQDRMLQGLRRRPKGTSECPLFAVGDPNQLIYEWRGADVGNILGVARRIGAQEHHLSVNWRSPQHILECANQALAANARGRGKPLVSARGQGSAREKVVAYQFDDALAEGRFHAERIARRLEEGMAPTELIVMARSAGALSFTELELWGLDIAYRVTAGRKFGTMTEIRDVAAWLRLLANPGDDAAAERCLTKPDPEGMGDKSVEKAREAAQRQGRTLMEVLPEMARSGALQQKAGQRAEKVYALWRELAGMASRQLSPQGLVGEIIELTGIGAKARAGLESKDEKDVTKAQAQIERLDDLRTLAGEHRSIRSLAEHLAMGDTRADNAGKGCVTLSTIHAAKGGEWRDVALVGVETDTLPSKRAVAEGTAAKIEEERRLLHVAVTRAKERCTLSWAMWRGHTETGPSSFVGELGQTLHVVVKD